MTTSSEMEVFRMEFVQSLVRFYHERVVDHYDNPRNVGSFDKNDLTVGTGLVGAPACGDVMKLQIKVDDDGKIVDACFKTFGCGSAIASSSVATEWVKGKQMELVSCHGIEGVVEVRDGGEDVDDSRWRWWWQVEEMCWRRS
ncbi:iron-binding protein [Ranunculus cassubicifolius]